ncbi:MAG: SH3 domain-containing protein [Burkholderiales bacterium]|nr:SH3 domain-containing protein [Anaerolineae bacterium]
MNKNESYPAMRNNLAIFLLWSVLVIVSAGCNLAQGDTASTPNALTRVADAPTTTPSGTGIGESSVIGLGLDANTCRLSVSAPADLRSRPDLFGGRILTLEAGTIAPIIGRPADNADWWQIQLGTTLGWVSAASAAIAGDCNNIPVVDIAQPTQAQSSVANAPTALPLPQSNGGSGGGSSAASTGGTTLTFNSDTNVRSGPGTVFNPPLGAFQEGNTTNILAVNPAGDWYKVGFGSGVGWVWSGLVSVSGSTSSLPVEVGPPAPPPTSAPAVQQQPVQPVQQQPAPSFDPNVNLLQDAGFDSNYTGRGRSDLNIPAAWEIWVASAPHNENWMNLPPVGFPHNGGPEVQSGSASLNLNKGYATFTAAVYQRVSVPQGVSMRAQAWAWLHTCDPAPSICSSDPGSGARVRVGIDPNGGSDPFDSDIVWSDSAPHDSWGLLGVTATSTGTTATVFLYMTQDWPRGLNEVYWDSAELHLGG